MKKGAVIAAVLTAGLCASTSARADVSLFDVNQQQIDASLAMRRSTTEQDNPIRGQSVLDRARPDFDPVPVPVGSFQLFPALNLGAYYDSNIFATPSNETDDLVWKVNPTATLASNWGRNALVFTGLGDFNYNTNQTKQDYNAGALQAEGRYDIAEETWLAGVAGYQRVVEPRGGLDTPGNAIGPSAYDLFTGGATAYRGVGRIKITGDFNTRYYDYKNIDLIGGGVDSQSSRDRTENETGAKVGYEVTKNFQPYVSGHYNWRNYSSSGVNSSEGYQVDTGAMLDFGGVTTANLYAGYIAQNYFNYANGTTDAFDFGADVLWNVTPLTSVEGKASRSIQETATIGQPSALASQGSVQVSHELRRDIVLQASVNYTAFDFQLVPRHDDQYDAGTGVRYYLNRNVYTDLTYDFQRRTSSDSSNNFDRNVALVRVGLQY
ncbi:MAG: outer membrane beta-barrel protein [Alphaproteobacteria bacterium]|nr:outer membrane beta-barrel protein [Alphaproteobacteria bacterium]